jgi:hypothetical protein
VFEEVSSAGWPALRTATGKPLFGESVRSALSTQLIAQLTAMASVENSANGGVVCRIPAFSRFVKLQLSSATGGVYDLLLSFETTFDATWSVLATVSPDAETGELRAAAQLVSLTRDSQWGPEQTACPDLKHVHPQFCFCHALHQ